MERIGIEGPPQKELLRPDEVAKYFSVTPRTIRKWCEHGHLGSIKIGKTLRITRSSVMSYWLRKVK